MQLKIVFQVFITKHEKLTEMSLIDMKDVVWKGAKSDHILVTE